MGGRGLGEPGLEKAIRHAALAMEEASTAPARGAAGDLRMHLQAVPFVRYRYGDGNRLTLRGPDGARELRHGEGFIVLHAGSAVRAVAPRPPVFVGFGISEPEGGHDDYNGLEVRGRMILIMEGVPDGLTGELREVYSDPTRGPARKYEAAFRHGVAGLIVIPHRDVFEAWDLLVHNRRERSFAAIRPYAGGELEDPELPVIALRRDVLEDLFTGRGYDPVQRTGEYRTFALDEYSVHLRLDVERDTLESHNVIGLVPGNDTRLANELVVVSAHLDHLGVVQGVIHNGANDDASGCAVVLETARQLVAVPAPRPVLFVLFTAEESEHLGSLHFLAEPPFPGMRIVASLNLEHVGRAGDGTLLATSSTELMDAVERVRRDVAPRRLRSGQLDSDGRNVSGSDSYSFHLHGIPLVILGGGGFPEYHGPEDDASRIDFDLLADATAISLAVVRELASPEKGAVGK